jgi:TonB family protein
VKAEYPAASGDKRNASVCLHLTVDKQGLPGDVQVASPQDPFLDKQAVAIAGGWRFQPGAKNGKPVEVPAVLTLIHGSVNRMAAGGREPE